MLLVKPPYRRSNALPVKEATVEKAVRQFGFANIDEAFEDWSALVGFLREQFLEARKEQSASDQHEAVAEELLNHAPRPVLEKYLNRIESELLPNGEWAASLNIVASLMRLESVRNDPRLCARAADLVKELADGRARRENDVLRLVEEEIPDHFPNAAKRFGPARIQHYSRDVKERHQILAVGT